MDIGFLDLAAQCAPQVPPATLAAIVRVETDFNPLAIRMNSIGGPGLPRQPQTRAEAALRAKTLLAAGHDLDLGLTGVPGDEFEKAGLPLEEAFEPCTSLKFLARFYEREWKVAVRTAPPEKAEAVVLASWFGRGDPSVGREAGYPERILEAKAELAPRLSTLALRAGQQALPRRERFKGEPVTPEPATSAPSQPAPPPVIRQATLPEEPQEPIPAWDVFGSTRSRGPSMVLFDARKGKTR